MNENKPLKIAIDGPVGAGKGTVATTLRKKLGGGDIYTGGTYRAVALHCLRNGIDVNDKDKVINILKDIEVDVEDDTIYLNGEDVTGEIKRSMVANAVPKVALLREVRDAMITIQRKAVTRELQNNNSIIVEGRDIGTNVLPDADLKVFLTADIETRARRRMLQLESYGEREDIEQVKREVEERDNLDFERENDPLEKDPVSKGYFVVDNSGQTEEQTADIILEEIKRRNLL